MRRIRNFADVFLALFPLALFGQHQGEEFSDDFHPIKLSVVLGHTYLPTATAEGKELLILPSFGLDLEYWFGPKFGIGLHNDLELLAFEVEKEEDLFIEREYPVLLTFDALWNPFKGLVFFGGPGIELEPEENFFVVRFGLEYGFEFGDDWDVFPTFFYDIRQDAYDTFSLGLGLGKRF